MIRHCVFIRFRPEIPADEKASIFAEIAALKSRLPGLLATHAGANVSPETGMDKGYAEGFIVDFADAAARDAYLDDPQHRQTGAKIVAAAQGGTDGIFVYDLEVRG
ncbi:MULTISPECIES: Dabb family protein [unclassified Ensifer]|uniref:Dabb family protein n=1 Tax=unclassified Ensifer TaxID=2633371 RepID=UPI000812DD3E|nr:MULTISPECIES: Dabb family protein [unclassified Ensifer]OCP17979.1 stress responsive protein [Ensifer sp. LC384]OCP21313.1 stress responsive protein [Ensifer sp. LC54]OCP37865.1 stress responsive protein [Ensifer sp. LC163]